jgi:hypothetical protein
VDIPSAETLEDARRIWDDHGVVLLPGHLDEDDRHAATAALAELYPTAAEFHGDADPERNARFRDDQFTGIDEFPWASVELNLLAVHERIVMLAEALLGSSDIRIYSAEAWAKYTGAVDYDQPHHRDFLNHTVTVPTSAPEFRQCEMFVYLSDVTDEHGATRFVSRTHTADIPLMPNWLDRSARPELYEHEASATGPAGTIAAYAIDTFHRGTNMTAPQGARYTLHLNFRPAAADWHDRHPWANRSYNPHWYRFVARATPRQLALFGFPLPGHPFWTRTTVELLAQRYTALDVSPWRDALRD